MSKIINIDVEFEKQSKLNEFKVDFNETNEFKFIFKDNYYAVISDKTEHRLNTDVIEARLYTPEHKVKSYNWASADPDEVECRLFNWLMDLQKTDEDKLYKLVFERGRQVGGGFL